MSPSARPPRLRRQRARASQCWSTTRCRRAGASRHASPSPRRSSPSRTARRRQRCRAPWWMRPRLRAPSKRCRTRARRRSWSWSSWRNSARSSSRGMSSSRARPSRASGRARKRPRAPRTRRTSRSRTSWCVSPLTARQACSSLWPTRRTAPRSPCPRTSSGTSLQPRTRSQARTFSGRTTPHRTARTSRARRQTAGRRSRWCAVRWSRRCGRCSRPGWRRRCACTPGALTSSWSGRSGRCRTRATRGRRCTQARR
mmetsp:Transcript_39575/g.93675  ORF Transcript_39575/g.93675 Transcript_39575/m.93675 type:complete len:256 (-) Transcript_39575:963-1730(-)